MIAGRNSRDNGGDIVDVSHVRIRKKLKRGIFKRSGEENEETSPWRELKWCIKK